MEELIHDIIIGHLAEWIALSGLVFGAGVAWSKLMKSQEQLSRATSELAKCSKSLHAEVDGLKATVQRILDRKDLFMQKTQCRGEQSICQKALLDRLDDIWEWLKEDRARGHSNALNIARLEEKIDSLGVLVRNGGNYGRNSG